MCYDFFCRSANQLSCRSLILEIILSDLLISIYFTCTGTCTTRPICKERRRRQTYFIHFKHHWRTTRCWRHGISLMIILLNGIGFFFIEKSFENSAWSSIANIINNYSRCRLMQHDCSNDNKLNLEKKLNVFL